jgi:hypothetical protein
LVTEGWEMRILVLTDVVVVVDDAFVVVSVVVV